jgi:hypothetical protein
MPCPLNIGSAWNTEDDPTKPWMDFDIHADLKIPLGFSQWLTRMGVGFASYEVIFPIGSPLEVPSGGQGAYDGETSLLRIRVKDAAEYVLGTKYPMTIRLFGDDSTSQDDATLYFRLVDK